MTAAALPPPPNGTYLESRRGAVAGSTTASAALVELFDREASPSVLAQGKRCAREDRVGPLTITPGRVHAQVTDAETHEVALTVGTWGTDVEQQVAAAAVSNPSLLTAIGAGDNGSLTGHGVGELLPPDIGCECTCRAYSGGIGMTLRPCRHVVALMFVFAERVDADPKVVAAWRGSPMAKLRRHVAAASAADQARAAVPDGGVWNLGGWAPPWKPPATNSSPASEFPDERGREWMEETYAGVQAAARAVLAYSPDDSVFDNVSVVPRMNKVEPPYGSEVTAAPRLAMTRVCANESWVSMVGRLTLDQGGALVLDGTDKFGGRLRMDIDELERALESLPDGLPVAASWEVWNADAYCPFDREDFDMVVRLDRRNRVEFVLDGRPVLRVEERRLGVYLRDEFGLPVLEPVDRETEAAPVVPAAPVAAPSAEQLLAMGCAQILYEDGRGERTLRVINPLEIDEDGDVDSYCHLRDDLRCFRPSRILWCTHADAWAHPVPDWV